MNFKWLGHSTVLIYDKNTNILIDPFITDNPACPVTNEELSPDYIIVTHGHGDHASDCIDIAKESGAKVISNFEICNWLNANGVSNTHPMNIGGSFRFPFGVLKQTIAHHSSVLPDGTYAGNPCGVLLFMDNLNFYFAGDTSLFLDMKLIGDENIDCAVLPIGDNFTMGPADAAKAVTFLKPNKVIPVHYNTFDVIAQNPDDFKKLVNEKSSDVDVVIVQPGEEITINN